MGIPVYFKTCIEDYSNICYPINNQLIDNLFFDLNCLIHPCCRGEIDENAMHTKILESIRDIFSKVNPRKLIFVAIDGPCPKPKMVQQRLRRFKSAKEKKEWDTNAITPGTQFMTNLEIYLLKHLKFNIKFTFSSSNEPGEGEQKIFDYIRKNKVDNNVVYGLDADLIMLSLISTSENIYLLRERTEYNIENIDSEFIYLDIKQLKKQIINKIKPKYYKLDNKTLINDYIFICFFIGNDFIQHTPSINIRYNGLEELLDVYNLLNERYAGIFYLTDTSTKDILIMSSFKEFIYELSLNEDKRIKNIMDIRSKQEHKYKRMYDNAVDKEDVIDHWPIIDRKREKDIFYDLNNWKQKYYMETIFHKSYSPIYDEILELKIKDMCTNYLQSLIWTLHYYLNDCIAWRFSYKYNNAPSFVDVYNTLKDLDTIEIDRDNSPYLPIEQLQIVLPVQSHNLINKKIETDYLHPIDSKECHILKRYLWESYPILPPI